MFPFRALPDSGVHITLRKIIGLFQPHIRLQGRTCPAEMCEVFWAAIIVGWWALWAGVLVARGSYVFGRLYKDRGFVMMWGNGHISIEWGHCSSTGYNKPRTTL